MMNITKFNNKQIMQVLSENEFYYEILRFCSSRSNHSSSSSESSATIPRHVIDFENFL